MNTVISALQVGINSQGAKALPVTSPPQTSVRKSLRDTRTVLEDIENDEIELLRQRNAATQTENA